MNLLILVGIFLVSFKLIELLENYFSNLTLSITEQHLLYALLVWIAFGWFSGLDYSEWYYSCGLLDEPLPNFRDDKLCFLSFFILLPLFFLRNYKWRILPFSLEFVFWIVRLYLVKKGWYENTYWIDLTIVSFYDWIGLLMRLQLGRLILQLEDIHWSGIIGVGILVLATKAMFFAHTPFAWYWESEMRAKRELERIELIGLWNGYYQNDYSDQELKSAQVFISEDSIYFDRATNDLETYYFDATVIREGELEINGEEWQLILNNYNEDSLYIDLFNYTGKRYLFSLAKMNGVD